MSAEIKYYNYTNRNPFPLAHKKKAISLIKEKMQLPREKEHANARRIAKHLNIPIKEAVSTVKELANYGYVQIGRPLKKLGSPIYGSNSLAITPGKNITKFLVLSDNEEE